MTKIESEAFDSVEVHEMIRVDGLMEMRAVSDLVVPATGQIQLKPGSKHLMLMGPRRHLTPGQSVAMTLIFQSGRKQTLSVKVAVR